MSRAASRERIARVRSVQHMRAAAAAVEANRHVGQLEASDAQLAALRLALIPRIGAQPAASIARIGDLAQRLIDARILVAQSIGTARETASILETGRIAKRIAQEAADRLHAEAARHERVTREQRAILSQRQRATARPTSLSPTKGNPA
jgi:hypothetical protein